MPRRPKPKPFKRPLKPRSAMPSRSKAARRDEYVAKVTRLDTDDADMMGRARYAVHLRISQMMPWAEIAAALWPLDDQGTPKPNAKRLFSSAVTAQRWVKACRDELRADYVSDTRNMVIDHYMRLHKMCEEQYTKDGDAPALQGMFNCLERIEGFFLGEGSVRTANPIPAEGDKAIHFHQGDNVVNVGGGISGLTQMRQRIEATMAKPVPTAPPQIEAEVIEAVAVEPAAPGKPKVIEEEWEEPNGV